MAVTDLASLRTQVKDWGNRTNISDTLVDSFINTALSRANRILRLPDMEASATLVVTEGVAPVPSDYEEVIDLTIEASGSIIALERKDIRYVTEKSTISSTPCFFARKLTNFMLAPIDSTSEAELYYYIKLDSLVNDTDTNFLITESPELLTYGALAELFLFLRDNEEAATYEAKFRSILQELQGVEDKAMWSGDTLAISS